MQNENLYARSGTRLRFKATYSLLFDAPFDTALNAMPRILFQASVLYLRKKLKIFARPNPFSENTVVDDTEHKDSNSKI